MILSNTSSNILIQLSERYAEIHGRIVFPLTILGILTSILTIIILKRKHFQTKTNLILEHIALFDIIVLISFNIYSFYFYILHDPNPFVGQLQFWPRFAIFHSNIGLTAHSIALWLTCLLAIIRYIIISKSKELQIKSIHIKIFIWLCVVLVCLLMIPNYLIWNVVRVPAYSLLPKLYTINNSETVYWVSPASGEYLEKVSFGILAICLKICPVIFLIIFIILLIIEIRHAQKLRADLLRRCSSMNSTMNLNREMRTTRMLVLITVCTVLVELPQGLFLIAIGINKYYFSFYSHLGDFWDLLSISSSFITFIMYCLMSEQFRKEMFQLISPKCLLQNSSNIPQRTKQNSPFIDQPTL